VNLVLPSIERLSWWPLVSPFRPLSLFPDMGTHGDHRTWRLFQVTLSQLRGESEPLQNGPTDVPLVPGQRPQSVAMWVLPTLRRIDVASQFSLCA
jgi:hypothetical protein